MEPLAPCPNCGGHTLYEGPTTSAGGGYAPLYLPGLGGFFRGAKFVLVVCRDCGLSRFFAEKAARDRLKDARQWKPVTPSDRGGSR